MLLVLLGMLFLASAVPVVANASAVSEAKTVSGGKWVTSGSKKKYQYSNGKYAKNAWLKIGSYIYRINSNGNLVKGWMTVGDYRYYSDKKTGRLYLKKWLTEGDEKYFFHSSGVMAKKKWVKIGKYYYYFRDDGTLAANCMITVGKKTYYVSRSGIRLTSTWVKTGGKKYYFDKNGVRVEKKWVKSGSRFYYLGKNGVMYVDRWVGNYYVGSDGARKTSCVVDGYYLDASGKKTIQVFEGNYIFVGDSRTVEMGNVKPSNDILYIGKSGADYDWLKSTAGETLRLNLQANPNVKVLLAFGINDYGNIEYYIDYYKNLIEDFPKTEFYILSINPVDEKKEIQYGYSITNQTLERFNKQMRKAIGKSHYIDAYTYMVKNGFDTRDGIHYTIPQYEELYQFIMSKI